MLLLFEPSLLAKINTLKQTLTGIGRIRTWKQRSTVKESNAGQTKEKKSKPSVPLFLFHSLVTFSTMAWSHPWHFPSTTWTLPSKSILNERYLHIDQFLGCGYKQPQCESLPYHLPTIHLLQFLFPSRFPHLLNEKVRAFISLMVVFCCLFCCCSFNTGALYAALAVLDETYYVEQDGL